MKLKKGVENCSLVRVLLFILILSLVFVLNNANVNGDGCTGIDCTIDSTGDCEGPLNNADDFKNSISSLDSLHILILNGEITIPKGKTCEINAKKVIVNTGGKINGLNGLVNGLPTEAGGKVKINSKEGIEVRGQINANTEIDSPQGDIFIRGTGKIDASEKGYKSGVINGEYKNYCCVNADLACSGGKYFGEGGSGCYNLCKTGISAKNLPQINLISDKSYGSGGGDSYRATSNSFCGKFVGTNQYLKGIGGFGGGKIIINAKSLSIEQGGKLFANGGNALEKTIFGSNPITSTSPGGGGSGGYLELNLDEISLSSSDSIQSRGGNGYYTISQSKLDNCGGGGSGGYIKIKYIRGNPETLNDADYNILKGGFPGGYPTYTNNNCKAGNDASLSLENKGTIIDIVLSPNSLKFLSDDESKSFILSIENKGGNPALISEFDISTTCPLGVIDPDDLENSFALPSSLDGNTKFPEEDFSVSLNKPVDACSITFTLSGNNFLTVTKILNLNFPGEINFELLKNRQGEPLPSHPSDPLINVLDDTVLKFSPSLLKSFFIKNLVDNAKFKLEVRDTDLNLFEFDSDPDKPDQQNGIVSMIGGQDSITEINFLKFKGLNQVSGQGSMDFFLDIIPCDFSYPSGQCDFSKKKTIKFTLNLLDLNLQITPNTEDPEVVDKKPGDPFEVTVNAFVGTEDKTSKIKQIKNITINGDSCSDLTTGNKAYCYLNRLDLIDGRNYDIQVEIIYESDTDDLLTIKSSPVIEGLILKDVTSPEIQTISHDYDSKTLTVITKDNNLQGVVGINVTLQYPDGTNKTLDIKEIPPSSNLEAYIIQNWNVTGFETTFKNKKHILNVTAYDFAGNFKTEMRYPTFADTYYFNGTLRDVDSLSRGKVASFRLQSLNTGLDHSIISSSNGIYTKKVDQGSYNLIVKNSPDSSSEEDYVLFENFSIENDLQDPINAFGESPAILQELPVDPVKTKTLAIIFNDSLDYNSKTINFNYKTLVDKLKIKIEDLRIYHCPEWDFDAKTCSGDWISYSLDNGLVLNRRTYTASVFFNKDDKIGAFALAELCEDCKPGGAKDTGVRDFCLKENEKVRVEVGLTKAELSLGSTQERKITFKSKNSDQILFNISIDKSLAKLIKLEKTSFGLSPFGEEFFKLNIDIPKKTQVKTYQGSININYGDEKISCPITLDVKSLQESEQLIKASINFISLTPSDEILISTQLSNVGAQAKSEAIIDYTVKDKEGKVVAQDSDFMEFYLFGSTQKAIKSHNKLYQGKYTIDAVIIYGKNKFTTATESFEVKKPFFQALFYNLRNTKLIGVPLLYYLLLILLGVGGYYGYGYYKKYLEKKRQQLLKYQVEVDLATLPKAGSRSSLLGKITELEKFAYVNLDMLKLHTIVAGSTGTGKTVGSQIIVEGALLSGVDVVVFDPSAQWSGFLKKCEENEMLNRYNDYDLKPESARPFLTNVKIIENPREILNLREVLKKKNSSDNKEGTITVYCLHKLKPNEIDLFIANTIKQIFETTPEESDQLKLLLVYDEIHRTLEKFGGKGLGLIQVERGLREFRKWGIGLVLISQVLSDFVGEIKANISTEIQMRTRYEGDLSRIKEKYGDKVASSLIKAPVGTGMFVNAEYNKGRPYFFNLRPLLHSKRRLSDSELIKYGNYSKQLDEVKYKLSVFKKNGVNIGNLDAELKEALNNLVSNNISNVNSSILRMIPMLKSLISKYPKINLKRQLYVKEEEINKSVKQASNERMKYVILENPYNDTIKIYNELRKKLGDASTLKFRQELLSVEKLIIALRNGWDDKTAESVRNRIKSVNESLKKLL